MSVSLAKQGECFPGCNLRYPGDINGSAAEVINCHCYLQVGVLLPGEKLNEDGSIGKADSLQSSAGSGTIKTDKQFGKKIGKHAADYGLDPSKQEDREQMRTIIDSICKAPDEVAYGDWRGQSGEVKFFVKGDDVVVATQTGMFVTILKGGVTNARVKNARRKQV